MPRRPCFSELCFASCKIFVFSNHLTSCSVEFVRLGLLESRGSRELRVSPSVHVSVFSQARALQQPSTHVHTLSPKRGSKTSAVGLIARRQGPLSSSSSSYTSGTGSSMREILHSSSWSCQLSCRSYQCIYGVETHRIVLFLLKVTLSSMLSSSHQMLQNPLPPPTPLSHRRQFFYDMRKEQNHSHKQVFTMQQQGTPRHLWAFSLTDHLQKTFAATLELQRHAHCASGAQ